MEPIRKSSELHDEIQEACIARARSLGLSPAAVAGLVNADLVKPEHVEKWLSRQSPMTTHKAQHVLAVLKLGVRAID